MPVIGIKSHAALFAEQLKASPDSFELAQGCRSDFRVHPKLTRHHRSTRRITSIERAGYGKRRLDGRTKRHDARAMDHTKQILDVRVLLICDDDTVVLHFCEQLTECRLHLADVR